jgi:hypothetical protein
MQNNTGTIMATSSGRPEQVRAARTRRKYREDTRKMVEQGFNLRDYMSVYGMFERPDAETYTQICEDFIDAENNNVAFVEPVKYKINEEQYYRIYKTPLSNYGTLLTLVNPKEHKISKELYYKLCIIAVAARGPFAGGPWNGDRGDSWGHEIACVRPEYLAAGKYKYLCQIACKTNGAALRNIDYNRLTEQEFVDIFMVAAHKFEKHECYGITPDLKNYSFVNPILLRLVDISVHIPVSLYQGCLVAYARKYGIDKLEHAIGAYDKNVLTNIKMALSAGQKRK